jgi:hypothetical protein
MWFAGVGQAKFLSNATVIMLIGNFIGTVVVLYFARIVVELLVRVKSTRV